MSNKLMRQLNISSRKPSETMLLTDRYSKTNDQILVTVKRLNAKKNTVNAFYKEKSAQPSVTVKIVVTEKMRVFNILLGGNL